MLFFVNGVRDTAPERPAARERETEIVITIRLAFVLLPLVYSASCNQLVADGPLAAIFYGLTRTLLRLADRV